MKNLRNLVIVGALMLVPAVAQAQTCNFIAGETVLREPNRSEQEILAGATRYRLPNGDINVRQFAGQVAIAMHSDRSLLENIPQACQDNGVLATAILQLNGMSGDWRAQQFVARVQSTGWVLPTMAAPVQAQAPAAAPAPQAAAATLPANANTPAPQPVAAPAAPDLRPQISRMESQLASLQARPYVELTTSERQQLASLPATLQQMRTAQAAAEAAAQRAATSQTEAASSAATAATAAAAASGSQTEAGKSARDAANSADASRASAQEANRWTPLFILAIVLAVAGFVLGVWNLLTKADRKVELKVDNIVDQMRIRMVEFGPKSTKALKTLKEGEEILVAVYLDRQFAFEVRITRNEKGEFVCPDAGPTSDPSALRLVRAAYLDGKFRGLRQAA